MEKIIVKVNISKVPNKLHFEVQRNTRMQVYKNRKAYTRKQKHKNAF